MNNTDLENIIQDFQSLKTEYKKETFLAKQRENILAQNKAENLQGFESIKHKLQEIRQKLGKETLKKT